MTPALLNTLINLAYLGSSILFILGLKALSHPRTAVRGNLMAAMAMLVAVLVTLLNRQILSFGLILAGLILGSLIGLILAVTIKMTAMPQLVALFNGFGGVASTLVASAALMGFLVTGESASLQFSLSTVAAAIIGAVTFWGSLVASKI